MRRLGYQPAQPSRWLGRGSKGKGVERKCHLSPQLSLFPHHLPKLRTTPPPPQPQSMRDGCWGRSDVCNVDKMSAILNGSGDAAVGGGEGERAEQGGERKGK